MRILYLITKSEFGGAQTNVYQLSKYFIERGDRVAIMAYPGGWLEEEAKKLKIDFYPNLYFRNSYNPFWGLRAMGEIKRALKDFKPDIVHCHSTVAGFWGRLSLADSSFLGFQNNLPVIFTAHGWGFTEGTSFFRRVLVSFAEKTAARYCVKIICVSEYDRRLALCYKIAPKDKLITIYNGVELVDRDLEPKVQDSKVKIVFVGRLAKPKTPEILLEVFFTLPKLIQQKSELIFVGEGPKEFNLKQVVKKKKMGRQVKFLGGMPREKIFNVLKKSDVFVLTSDYEGLPLSILEAMACGLPVIASDVGGISEIVDSKVGYLIKKRDKKKLKKALVELVENPGLIREKGRRAREKAKRSFSLEKMLNSVLALYKEALNFSKLDIPK